MSSLRAFPGRVIAALFLALLATAAAACDEDSKAVPARCTDPALPLFDAAHAGAPGDDNARYNDADSLPCVTEVGHGISFFGTAGSSTAPATAGTAGSGGKAGGGGIANGGNSGSGGTSNAGGADAGAGGA